MPLTHYSKFSMFTLRIWLIKSGVLKKLFILSKHGTKANIRSTKMANKMNCELMLTYDTPALRQTGSRNLMGPKTLPTIWGTDMKLVTKYQICVINSC